MSRFNLSLTRLPTRLSLFALVISASVGANESKVFDQTHLYGSWNCQHAIQDASTMMKIDYNINYSANGNADGNGTVRLRMQNFPEMEYSLSSRSTWEVKGASLILSSVEFKLVNRTHPELDQILNLESLFPQNIRESSTLLELTQLSLVARSDTYGGVYSCSKRASKS